jgi:hypothetical protein
VKSLIPTLLLALLASCAAPPNTPRRLPIMYTQAFKDLGKGNGMGEFRESVRERQEERFVRVRELAAEDRIETGEQFRFAAALLAMSDNRLDLELAQELGKRGAELGDLPARWFIAEATDKLLMIQGKPQKYGTQVNWIHVFSEYRLYKVDPATTDQQRAMVGLPPLADLQRLAEMRNEGKVYEAIRGKR